MIGELPTTLEVNGTEYDIRTDFRDCLGIIEAFTDEDLTDEEKAYCALFIMYKNYEQIPQSDIEEAYRMMIWFLDGGVTPDKKQNSSKPLMDWKQDEAIYFPAINKVAGHEIRLENYVHFWTFLGYYNEIGEGVFSTVLEIRAKKNRGKKLEKYEQDFYNEHKAMIDLKRKYTKEEMAELDELNSLLKPHNKSLEP